MIDAILNAMFSETFRWMYSCICFRNDHNFLNFIRDVIYDLIHCWICTVHSVDGGGVLFVSFIEWRAKTRALNHNKLICNCQLMTRQQDDALFMWTRARVFVCVNCLLCILSCVSHRVQQAKETCRKITGRTFYVIFFFFDNRISTVDD